MAIDIKAPTFPESVTEGSVATWHKQPGEAISRDEILVDIETDKVVLEVPAPVDGVLEEILAQEGETVVSEQLLARIKEGAVAAAPAAKAETEAAPTAATEEAEVVGDLRVAPAARKLAAEKGLDLASIKGSGKGGLITKEDVMNAPSAPAAKSAAAPVQVNVAPGERIEKRVPMSRMRQTIAKRLVHAQQTAAMLTTYNEVDMKPIMEMRKQYKDLFEKRHDGVRLGFMSFFVKAATEALKRFPDVNASIDGTAIVYNGY